MYVLCSLCTGCMGEWCLRQRLHGLVAVVLAGFHRPRAAFDLDVFHRLGAALDLDGLDRLGVAFLPMALDP